MAAITTTLLCVELLGKLPKATVAPRVVVANAAASIISQTNKWFLFILLLSIKKELSPRGTLFLVVAKANQKSSLNVEHIHTVAPSVFSFFHQTDLFARPRLGKFGSLGGLESHALNQRDEIIHTLPAKARVMVGLNAFLFAPHRLDNQHP